MANCQEITPCNPCNPEYSDTGCLSYPKTGCVIYNGEDIACLNITKNENLNEVLQHLKDIVCTLQPTAYADFDFSCFASEGITTEKEFVEFISSLLCTILGSQTPSTITSLSSLNALIAALTVDVNLIKNQTLTACFQTLSGLGTPQTISILLTAIQTIICDHEDRIVALEGGATNTPITAINLNKNVVISASGTNNHTLSATILLDPDGSNALTTSAAGLMCLSPDIIAVDTQSIDFSTSSIKNHTITGSVKISSVGGNGLSILGDGLYVNPIFLETTLVANDSTSIDFTSAGVNGHTITANIILDPNPINALQITGSGLFVDASSLTLGNNSVTNAILRDSVAYSVIGRTSGTTGDPADITANTDQVLRRSGSGNLAFGTLVTNNIGDNQITFAKTQNISSSRILGRSSGGSGDIEQLTVGTGLDLSGGTLSAIPSGITILDGNYTPTLSNTTNISSSTAFTTNYYQIGEMVTVFGAVEVTTSGAGAVVLGFTCPVTTAFLGLIHEAAGTGADPQLSNEVISISPISSSNSVKFRWVSAGVVIYSIQFQFSYKIITP